MSASSAITARSILLLSGVIGGVTAAVSLTAREIIQAGDNFTNLKSRLALFAQEGTNTNSILDALTDAANRAHAPVGALAEVYSRNAAALNTLGVSTTDQIRLNETLYKALVVGGNATQSGREALIQFSQSLNSGVFRGQEFNSVNEQATEIIRILARETGKTQGELRKLANEGALTAQVAVNALLNGSKDLDAAFAKMPQTVSQATAQFQSAFSIVLGQSAEAVGTNRALAEAIGDWTSLLGSDAGRGIIDHFSNSLKEIATWAGDAAGEIKIMAAETAIAAERQQKAADSGFTWAKALESVWTISKMGIGFWVDQAKHVATGTFGMSVEEQKAIRAQAEAQAGWNTTTTRADAISTFDTNQAKRAIKFGSGTNEEDEKRRKRVIEQISKQLDLEKSRVAITQAQIDGNTSQVQVLTTEMEIRQRISDEMRKADPTKAAALENEIRLQDALAIRLKAVQEIQQRNTEFANDFAGTITSAFVSAIKGGQSFSQTLKQLGLDIIDVITKAAVLEPLGKSIGSSLSSALNGGSSGGFDIGNIFGLGGGDVGLGSWAPTISAFASGGVVDKPTGFAFGGGLGVAGEDGPEAILPLTRAANGDLGVHASGFGGATVVNNWSVSIAGDATDATVARLQATMEQTIAARTPGIIDQAKMAVARTYKNDRNYLRR
jgi:tape measure domain-containing protein